MALGCIAPFGEAYDRAGLTRGDKFGRRSPDASPSGLLARQNSPSTSRAEPLPVENSPRTPALAAYAGQNSPCSPEMAQFGAFYACRESFIPFSPPRSRQREFCTEREAEIERADTTAHQAHRCEGHRRDWCGGRRRKRRACPRCRWAAAGHGRASRRDTKTTPHKFRMQFDLTKFQQTQKTLQFQRCKFNV